MFRLGSPKFQRIINCSRNTNGSASNLQWSLMTENRPRISLCSVPTMATNFSLRFTNRIRPPACHCPGITSCFSKNKRQKPLFRECSLLPTVRWRGSQMRKKPLATAIINRMDRILAKVNVQRRSSNRTLCSFPLSITLTENRWCACRGRNLASC